MNRRTLLQQFGGLLCLTGLSANTRGWGTPRFDSYPFRLGVASGDPASDGFVIWTRLAPQPLQEHGGMPARAIPLRWEVALDERFARVVQKGEVLARPE